MVQAPATAGACTILCIGCHLVVVRGIISEFKQHLVLKF